MIEFQNVSKAFGGVAAVRDLSLTLERGEFTVLIGGSGSGKSTTLKMINRLCEHDTGRILFQGEEIRSFRPEDLRRRMGYAIQSTGLFPHWTVERNVATVPTLLKWPAARIRARVAELLELLGLPPGEFLHRHPHQLSGGQQQRVGVARALAGDPEVLLMDEPFGALDPLTRAALQQEMARIHRVSGTTIVLVTHDIDEALSLATRLVLLDQGRLVQAGTPTAVLTHPATEFVVDFLGRSERGIRLLGLETVRSRARPDGHAHSPAEGDAIADTLTLRDALSVFVARGTQQLPVVDAAGQPAGVLHVGDLLRAPA